MPNKSSWVQIPEGSDFTIHNLPFGIFSIKNGKPRVGIAIGNQILDLAAVARLGHFDALKIDKKVFSQNTLNDFISLGKSKTSRLRKKVQQLLSSKKSPLIGKRAVLIAQSKATMHMPVAVGDYTDFYSSIEHATNLGKMFRDPKNALLPNWRHLPVGYHGRASSIVVSGTPIHRPKGQVMPVGADKPIFKASGRLDFELETAFIIGKENKLGNSIPVNEAEDYIFGKVLFNDWSARDIQKWEYVPLGPFLGKSFASSISPWIVTMDALEPFRTKGPVQKPKVLPYLKYKGDKNFNINLQVSIQPQGKKETVVSNSNFKFMYWNMSQQLAHHTVNGCNTKVGDMMASGTISGRDNNSFGSMLEISHSGKNPVTLDSGEKRAFIEDNDTVIMRGYCEKDGMRVGFGEVRGKVLPAR